MTPLYHLRRTWVLAAGLALLVGCKRNETKTLLEPSQALSSVLAEEAIRAAGTNKKIAVISHDDSWGPPSPVEQAFKDALEGQGFSVFTAKSAYLGDPMLRRQIGLQPDDFFEAVEKASDAGAIVSFAGAPLLKPEDSVRMPRAHPPIVIVATTTMGDQLGVPAPRSRLAGLLEDKIIQAAIVNGGSDSDAPSSSTTDATHKLFTRNYSILRQPQ